MTPNADAFVAAATEQRRTRAEALLAARPEIGSDPWARLVLGDGWDGDASKAGGPFEWAPLLYVTHSCFASVELARNLLDREVERIRDSGAALPRQVKVGAMLEVPALIYQLADLLREVDFLSVGTNDLFQFLFASDRGNYRISEAYDVLSPVLLKLLRSVVEQCEAAGVPVSICGEMAARPLDAMALLGIGFRNLSVSPPAVGPIKMMVRSMQVTHVARYLEKICLGRQGSLREKLKAYAQDHGIII